MPTSESPAIRNIKREARKAARNSNLTYSQILDQRATASGYSSWKELRLANPLKIADPISTDGWSAIIRFPSPIDMSLWDNEELTPEISPKLAWDIHDALNFSEPTNLTRKNNCEIILGAHSRHHALSILGSMPISYFISHNASLSIRNGSVETEIPYRTESLSGDDRQIGMPFYADDNRDIEWDGSEYMANSPWDLLTEICYGSSTDALYYSDEIDYAETVRRTGQVAAITARAGTEHIKIALYEDFPSWEEIEYGNNHIQSWANKGVMDLGWTDDADVTSYITDNEFIIHAHGIFCDLVMRSPKGEIGKSSPITVITEFWWRDRHASLGGTVSKILFGDERMFLNSDRLPPTDRAVYNLLSSYRSLGEIPIPENGPPWPISSDRNRCLALYGDFPQ